MLNLKRNKQEGRRMKNILIAIEGITPEQEQRMKAAAGANEVRFIEENQATVELADWADIIIGNIPQWQ